MQSNHIEIKGVDALPARRPGVPQQQLPKPVGTARWTRPDRQVPDTEILKDVSRDTLTATFGTGPAPRGLSGLMRRAAYRIPDYRARRWMLLLAADRVDGIESRLARVPPAAWVLLGAGVIAGAWRVSRAR